MAWYSGFPGGGWGAGAVGLSAMSDLLGAYQQHKESQRRNQLFKILSDPGALAGYIQRMHQPLSQAQQQEIARNTQAEMGMRGVGDSRYADLAAARAYAGVESDAYGRETQAALQALGGMYPYQGQGGAPGGATGDMLRTMMLLKAFQQPKKDPSMTAGFDWSSIEDPYSQFWGGGSVMPGTETRRFGSMPGSLEGAGLETG